MQKFIYLVFFSLISISCVYAKSYNLDSAKSTQHKTTKKSRKAKKPKTAKKHQRTKTAQKSRKAKKPKTAKKHQGTKTAKKSRKAKKPKTARKHQGAKTTKKSRKAKVTKNPKQHSIINNFQTPTKQTLNSLSLQRQVRTWSKLEQLGSPIFGAKLINPYAAYGDRIYGLSTDRNIIDDRSKLLNDIPGLKLNIRALWRKSTTGRKVTPIHYHVYAKQQILKGREKAKGVFINVYGAGIKNNFQKYDHLNQMRFIASQGYICYDINVRGTQGYGGKFVESQGKAHGIKSIVRDLAYFSDMLRSQNKYSSFAHRPSKKQLRRPGLHQFVPKDAKFFLGGGSFGGYVTSFVATSSEHRFKYVYFDGNAKKQTANINIPESFDGYLPSVSYLDIEADYRSYTRTSILRRGALNGSGGQVINYDQWQQNAFMGLRPDINATDNKILSPTYRVNNIKRPMLFRVGALDTNVSPRQTCDFIDRACQNTRTRAFIGLHADMKMGHSLPTSYSILKSEYEKCFRFMDAVRLTKGVFKFNKASCVDTRQKCIALRFMFRGDNPDVSRGDTAFLLKALRIFLHGNMTPNNSFINSVSNLQGDFYRAVLHKLSLDVSGSYILQDLDNEQWNTKVIRENFVNQNSLQIGCYHPRYNPMGSSTQLNYAGLNHLQNLIGMNYNPGNYINQARNILLGQFTYLATSNSFQAKAIRKYALTTRFGTEF